MKPIIKQYTESDLFSEESILRTLILFGRNVSTYKFALADVLLSKDISTSLSYTDIRDDFVLSLYKHYQSNPHQYQAGENSLTRAFDDYAQNNEWNKLVKVAEKNIYKNVFKAFHNVGGASIKEELVLFEHDIKSKQLIITDSLLKLKENQNLVNQLILENQTRWNIVEEAWKNSLTPNMLVFNSEDNTISSINSDNERINLRSAVDALLPYQHGKCFYCGRKLNKESDNQAADFPDVDHVLPFTAFQKFELFQSVSPNGFWNLVIACKECNRGASGKFDAPPDQMYYTKLINRNRLFTEEHNHSLRNTILMSLSANSSKQVEKRMRQFQTYLNILNGWTPKLIFEV